MEDFVPPAIAPVPVQVPVRAGTRWFVAFWIIAVMNMLAVVLLMWVAASFAGGESFTNNPISLLTLAIPLVAVGLLYLLHQGLSKNSSAAKTILVIMALLSLQPIVGILVGRIFSLFGPR